MKPFRCLLPSTVEFGPGKAETLSRLVEGESVLLLTDPGVTKSGIADRAAALCSSAEKLHEYREIPPEPTEEQMREIAARLGGTKVSVIVAVGGGSVMDAAKLLAVMLDGAELSAMFDGVLPKERKTRLVMLPTTAGTGSEATPNAIVLRASMNLKVGIVCDLFIPDQVILDPELLADLPPPVTASTGMDALCHALECYVSNKANPLSDLFAVEAIRLIFRSLRASVKNGSDIEARSEMMLASFYAGICIASSGTTAVHALSYPLGGRYRIPHGVSNAVLLAPVFAFNRDACIPKLAAVAHFAGKPVEGMTDDEKAVVLVDALAGLTRDLGIPETLHQLGVPPEDLDSIVDAALEVKRLLDNNPKVLGRADVRSIYTAILC